MNNIKEFLARFWQHVILHDASTLDAANAYTDEKIADIEIDAAGTNLGTVKTGGDVSITNGIITVNDDSHNHTIANIDDLQTTLNGKQATIIGAATTITGSNLTTSRALISNSSGKIAVSDVTATELGYLDGVTSAIQTQLNEKVPTTRTINNKALSSNITLSASDVGAAPASAGLPTVSASNNGKILQVSNGAWAVADAPQGFSGSWNDLTNKPFADMNALITEIKSQIGYPVVSATAPTLTNSNIIWIDTSNGGIAKYHNGSAWVAITSVWK